jgi:tripartite ATP-independent transporter DctM subunit
VLAVAFGVGIVAMARLVPGFTGHAAPVSGPAMGWGETAAKAGPIAFLILVVLGGLYGGLFTPVEAGAVGAIAALAVGFAQRRLGLRALWSVLVETGLVTAAVCFLIIGAQIYGRMLSLSGVPQGLAQAAVAADLGFWGLMVAYVAVILLLGMILDSASIMLIVVPLMLPVVKPMGVDLVWFGIVTVIAVEIGLLTPPFGISVYVIKSTLDDAAVSLGDIFRGAAPFAAIMLAVLALVMAVPAIATGLLPGR